MLVLSFIIAMLLTMVLILLTHRGAVMAAGG